MKTRVNHDACESLYKRQSDGVYLCMLTNNKCDIATKHFKKLSDTIAQSIKDGRIFITKEHNLCKEKDCPIWLNFIELSMCNQR